ncbi:retron system putative HNH endonuclease [Desulfoluna sp.]|uniref:retron system putative HNH endonuclease n=1 Tax=Desulfoluna sp. TaxID=2045199 RepID=UPI0026169A89|nr:retron system putative HNH endonuclease [Desulfoluna sp.]
MHKLKRPSPPNCLSKYRHGRDNWSLVTIEDKKGIWVQLHAMQGNLCAYCESPLLTQNGQRDAHIEHFRQKGKDPRVTFEWDNLFGSCNRKISCGRHKDAHPAYDPALPIKMDEEDPITFSSLSAMAPSPSTTNSLNQKKNGLRVPWPSLTLTQNMVH